MKKLICWVMCLILFAGITSCGKPDSNEGNAQSAKEKDYKKGVIDAAELTIHNGVVFWGYGQQLCSALLDEEGNICDVVSEGSLSTEIYSMAIDGEDMYLSTEKGIVCLHLAEADQEQSQLSVIDDHELNTSAFQIYKENIYFRYGTSLYRVPRDGGEDKMMESDIEAFQVTTEGVYCLNSEGELIWLSLDGLERKTLHELDCEKGMIYIYKDKAYITTGEKDHYIYEYGLEDDSVKKIHFENDLSPYRGVWPVKDCIYYESEDYKIYRYELKTEKETQSDVLYDLPDYECGCMEDEIVYYAFSDDLYWMHLDTGESVKIGKGEALEGSFSGLASEPDKNVTAQNGKTDYNIAENIGVFNSEGQVRLESEYFTLYLPADGEWTYEVIDETTVAIYYEPAYQSGDGGHLVSIQAYDKSDNSYEDIPSYTIAGVSEDKKYIAIFPTDVQYNSEQEKGYTQMLQYVQRIDNSGEKAADNPFSCK